MSLLKFSYPGDINQVTVKVHGILGLPAKISGWSTTTRGGYGVGDGLI
jgi:hypothetical protein